MISEFWENNKLLLKVLLLFAVLCVAAWLLAAAHYRFLLLVIPVGVFLLYDLYRYQQKAQNELRQFVESVHYRDFTRYFDVKHAPSELQPLRKGFNEINTAFKVISKEKETQYQYLQRILELVDTGILSYELATGNVVWMNEALKRMLQIPYLKTIDSLSRRDTELGEVVKSIKPGEVKIATAHLEKDSFKVLVSCSAFQTESQTYKLIAFQNVNEALDETESKAWQRLLSVMTHEIMNSVAPISSLADTLKKSLHKAVGEFKDSSGNFEDLELGIETIKRRSEGLLRFAETYRNLNKITKLNLETVQVLDLFVNLQQLMQPKLEQLNIEVEIILKEPGITIEADTNLVDQVLINLLINAMDAVREQPNPRIVLSASKGSNNRTQVKVADNGVGMPAEIMDKIFIPFFSTKKSGSGIGLSLCKQIMMLHKGNISVHSVEGEGTAFILQF
ncbi:HAMP domain-containing sensor histidine kinase [Flavihumibacter sp. CACIAM 22H1]|uniref:sensor histidine kinase n=1 Tax=Flavihumibacter sp. CACIAM 22H1 TaxID=1812911 RepID=UPI0007A7FB0E|nr:HAMP domain-containing sensor histidine kinase [Flavihumibacter sp. CACIAM 22H1]KYP12958.1 MAG: histidine kinase [Flavihumibacter sp. CACIAM 22H1]